MSFKSFAKILFRNWRTTVIEQLKSGLSSMISDVDGSVSSKRVVTFLCVAAMLVTWGANLFWGFQITEFIFEGLMYIIIVGLGVATAEKFSRKGSSASTDVNVSSITDKVM